jgi:flagellar protein FlgJ
MEITPLSSAGSNPTASADPKRIAKIHDAAQQFEALMITQMMKTVRETNSDGWLSDGGETGEDSTMSMAEAQFAQAMASRGGLGLAKMIVKAMTPSSASSASTGSLNSPPSGSATPALVSQPGPIMLRPGVRSLQEPAGVPSK